MRTLLIGSFLLLPTVAGAQVSAELRAGGAIGNHAPAAAGLETAPGLSIAGSLLITPREWLAVYATYARSAFGCEEGFCSGRDVSVITSALGGGLRIHARPWAWLQAGVVNLSAAVDADGTREPATSAFGYEGGIGLRFPVSARAAVVPAVLYRTGFEEAGRTTVLAAELGMQVRLR